MISGRAFSLLALAALTASVAGWAWWFAGWGYTP